MGQPELQVIANCCANPEEKLAECLKFIDYYEQDSSELELRLDQFVSTLTKNYFNQPFTLQKHIAKIFYSLCKVCKWKNVCVHLDTNKALLFEILQTLSNRQKNDTEEENLIDYLLLSWLYIIINSPFSLENSSEIYDLIYNLGKQNQLLVGMAANANAVLLIKNPKLKNIATVLKNSQLLTNNYLKRMNNSIDDNLLNQISTYYLIESNEVTSTTIKIISNLFKFHIKKENYEWMETIITWFLQNVGVSSVDLRYLLAHKYSKLVTTLITHTDDEFILEDLFLQKIDELASLLNEFDPDPNLIHSYLLIIAELSKTFVESNYTPKQVYIEKITTIVNITSKYQRRVRNQIQGEQIRDASNFIIWSLSKSNKLSNYQDIGKKLFITLLTTTFFDHSLPIRNSANAAMQELLGRHGSVILDNVTVLRIIELPVSNIDTCYTENLLQLYHLLNAKYPELWDEVLNHLICYNIFKNQDLQIVVLTINAVVSLCEAIQIPDLSEKILSSDSACERKLYAMIETQGVCTYSKELLSDCYKSLLEQSNLTSLASESNSFIVLTFLKYWISNPSTLNNKFLVNFIRNANSNSKFYSKIENAVHTIFKTNSSKFDMWDEFNILLKFNIKLACTSIPYFPSSKFLDTFTTIISHLDSHGKSYLLTSLNDTFKNLISTDLECRKIIPYIVEMLDDYTITNQGDVGRLVRTNAAKIISNHFNYFVDEQHTIIPKAQNSLLRLVAEPQKELRQCAFDILKNYKKYVSNIHHSFEMQILQFNYEIFGLESQHFWNGYINTAGAIHSTDLDLKAAIDSFLKFFYRLDIDEKSSLTSFLFKMIVPASSLIKVKKMAEKLELTNGLKQDPMKSTVMCLKFWNRTLISGLEFPTDFNFEGAYVKIHNLQILKGSKLLKVAAIETLSLLPLGQKKLNKKLIELVVKRLLQIAKNEEIAKNTTTLEKKIAIESLSTLLSYLQSFEALNDLVQQCETVSSIEDSIFLQKIFSANNQIC